MMLLRPFFLWIAFGCCPLFASLVDQLDLESLISRQELLENNLSIIQQKELVGLETYLRQSFMQFEKAESLQQLDVDLVFVQKASEYATLLTLTKTKPTSFYYDLYFWVRYIPTFVAQEDLQDLKAEKLTFPLSSQYAQLVKNFTNLCNAYINFFEQWPADMQKSSQSMYYAKAQSAYKNFLQTQAFVVSLLARQQSIKTTEDQMKTLISQFRNALYNRGVVTIAQKTQYDTSLDIYGSQTQTTLSQEYKQYHLWSFMASLLYYQERAGLPQPKDKTNAELFHEAYSGFGSFLDSYQKTWMYYADGQEALSGFMDYNAQCKILLEPKPTPKPVPVVPPLAPVQTVTEQLDAFIMKNFTDAMIGSFDAKKLADGLARYKNLVEDYKKSAEYREVDFQQYQLWADFVPVRYAEFKVIALSGVKDPKKAGVILNFSNAFNAFRRTSSYSYVRKAYPSLDQELVLCSYYGNWLSRQK